MIFAIIIKNTIGDNKMKKNIISKAKLFVVVLILILVSLTFSGKTVSASAEGTKNNEQLSENQSNIQSMVSTENYRYSKAKDPKFIIKDVDGTIAISEEVIVRFEEKVVVVPNFNFYHILDSNYETRFYQADTITDNPDYSAFAYIGIFLPSIEVNEDHIVMYLQYGVAETMTLYNVKIILNNLEFDYFDAIAQPLVLGDDDVSQRLKISKKVSQYGAYEEELVENKQSTQQKAMSIIRNNAYDSYTNSDGIIHDYVNDYFGHHIVNGYVTDDPIVNIIPKELCFILGEHFYIGKEYGFFIKVMIDETVREDYEVDIFVFDIQYTIPSFPSDTTGSTKVVPLFQYKYRAMDRNRRNNWVDLDQSLTRIVIRHVVYDAAEYYMNDVCFRHTLSNPTLLNPGDEGYIPDEDDGAFIVQSRYNSRGVGLKSKGGSFLHDTIIFGFGFVPYVSYAANVYSYVYNLYCGFGSEKSYFYNQDIQILDEEVYIDTKETNNSDQIDERHNLIRSVTTKQNGDSTKPRIIHVGGGHATAKYVVARKSKSKYNKFHVVASISANILEDNTSRYWMFGWHENGEIVNYGRATGTYQVSNYERLNDVIASADTSFNVNAEEKHKVAKFIPPVSGKYRLETSNKYGDPNFSLTDATTKITYDAQDDIDRETNQNARLDIYLYAGHIYYIDAFCYNLTNGYYSLRICYFPEASIALSRNTDYSCKVEKQTYQMYKFNPTVTGYYDIFVIAQSGDPYLFLLDSNGNKLKENDDGLGNLNPLITNYLFANKTYYIAIQGYGGNSSIDGTLKITPSIVDCNEIFINEAIDIIVDGNASVLEFIAPYTGDFKFFTFNNMGDPYLELYDYNRNRIAYNDDNEIDADEGMNSLIIYNLVEGEKYYIYASSYDVESASYGLCIK